MNDVGFNQPDAQKVYCRKNKLEGNDEKIPNNNIHIWEIPQMNIKGRRIAEVEMIGLENQQNEDVK